ncbi:hypothetical protein E4O00_07090 [Treponema sp. OMZ 788]|uniref:hypothetical protein n=1 Tax=unclassified Treponema TaxID=2638727 RepID=UPI0020A5FB36|nr:MULTISPECIES: hypothetical protein [unclassified Treponema]UTC63503.1 hypothetical protein E4O05_06360 [Treponema sp. OMZ 787]UTC63713.1 hypothetical protein E4O00_07090 [Treponema sp. OMZ 788]
MKKIRTLTFFFLIISLSLSAFEAGGIFKTGIGLDVGQKNKNQNLSLSHFDSLSLWAKQNLDKEGNYNFAIQASYLLNLKKPIKPQKKFDAKNDITHIANLDMLKFSFLIPIGSNSFNIEAGRYNISDITATILNQNIDGIYLSYTMPQFSTFFNLGYTGLLNTYVNPINTPDIKAISSKEAKIYNLAPSFAHISALFKIPFASLRHTANLDLNSFIATSNPKDTNNYISISLNGPIVKGLFYNASVTSSIITRNKKDVKAGFFVLGELNYYFKKYSSKIGLKSEWFSGGKQEFKSFTVSNASKVKFIESNDLWKTGLNGSIKPIADLFLSTEFNIMTHGMTQPKGKNFLKGFEWSTSVNYTILQDIAVSGDLGMFIEKNGNIDARIGLKGIISF